MIFCFLIDTFNGSDRRTARSSIRELPDLRPDTKPRARGIGHAMSDGNSLRFHQPDFKTRISVTLITCNECCFIIMSHVYFKKNCGLFSFVYNLLYPISFYSKKCPNLYS